MKALRRHVRGIVAVAAVVLGLGVAGAAVGGHLSNVKADSYAAGHPASSLTRAATASPAAPAKAAATAPGAMASTRSGGDGTSAD